MIGYGEKYRYVECEPFKLPHQVLIAECQIRNERHFIEFLLRNDWIQRRVGIRMPSSNGFFPDIKGEIYDGTGDPIKVEVEFWAENYKLHGHEFKGCDLILSFFRSPETRFVKGVPVWSFYECYKNDKWGLFCLDSDIRYNFDEHKDYEDMSFFEKHMYNLGGNYYENYVKSRKQGP